jgi:enoyl-CoA hydratase/carnithine racemase
MVRFLTDLVDLEKPIVALVGGGSIGIACTMLGFFDFIYTTPDAFFMTPFM